MTRQLNDLQANEQLLTRQVNDLQQSLQQARAHAGSAVGREAAVSKSLRQQQQLASTAQERVTGLEVSLH